IFERAAPRNDLTRPVCGEQRSEAFPVGVHFQDLLRIIDGRFDLAPVANDPFVRDESFDVRVVKPRNDGGVETSECLAEGLPASENEEPTQPDLEHLKAQALEELRLIHSEARRRHSPLGVVVVTVEVIAVSKASSHAPSLHDWRKRNWRGSGRLKA